MKTIMHIGEKIFGVLLWPLQFLLFAFAMLLALPMLPRYLKVKHM